GISGDGSGGNGINGIDINGNGINGNGINGNNTNGNNANGIVDGAAGGPGVGVGEEGNASVSSSRNTGRSWTAALGLRKSAILANNASTSDQRAGGWGQSGDSSGG
ncbi:unnamed protein product, partial [Laminaria digitata]